MREDEKLPICLKDCAIGPSQLRAARSMLDWSRGVLAKEAKLSAETIKNIEHGVYFPKEETIKTLVETFARKGIQFVQHEAIVSVPAGCGQAVRTLIFSHVSIVRVMVSSPETVGGHHD